MERDTRWICRIASHRRPLNRCIRWGLSLNFWHSLLLLLILYDPLTKNLLRRIFQLTLLPSCRPSVKAGLAPTAALPHQSRDPCAPAVVALAHHQRRRPAVATQHAHILPSHHQGRRKAQRSRLRSINHCSASPPMMPPQHGALQQSQHCHILKTFSDSVCESSLKACTRCERVMEAAPVLPETSQAVAHLSSELLQVTRGGLWGLPIWVSEKKTLRKNYLFYLATKEHCFSCLLGSSSTSLSPDHMEEHCSRWACWAIRG